MKKLFTLLIAAFMMIQLASVNVMAASPTLNDEEQIFTHIMSDEVKEIIAENIDLSLEGTQSVDVGYGMRFVINIETTESITRAASTKTGSVSGYFYTVSDNKKVADYALTATFKYTGSSVEVDSSDITSTPANDNWKLDGNKQIYESSSQLIVSGTWVLYQKVGILLWQKYEYNNDVHIDIICTKSGVITYNYK